MLGLSAAAAAQAVPICASAVAFVTVLDLQWVLTHICI